MQADNNMHSNVVMNKTNRPRHEQQYAEISQHAQILLVKQTNKQTNKQTKNFRVPVLET